MPQFDPHFTPQPFVLDTTPDTVPLAAIDGHDVSFYEGVVEAVSVSGDIASRDLPNHDWLLIIFLAIFSGIAYIRVVHPKRLKQIFKAVIAMRFTRQVVREDLLLTHPVSLTLSAIFVLSGSALLFELQEMLGIQLLNGHGFLLFGKFALILIGVYLIKVLVIKLLQFMMQGDGGLNEYIYTLFLFNNVLGLLLLPVTIGLAYQNKMPQEYLIWVAAGLVVLLYATRIIRGLRAGISYNISIFHLIAYLCTLEILPLIVFARFYTVIRLK